MTEIPTFSSAMIERLSEFLTAPERPEGTMSYCECAGFLFAVSCSPELVRPSEWIPLLFNGQDAGYESMEEAQEILQVLMALYNHINGQVFEKSPASPPGCGVRGEALSNLEEDAPLSQWARGFLQGHQWLSELWDEYTPDEIGDELGSLLMVLSFFANRELAQAFHRETATKDKSIEEMCETMLGLHADAMTDYAHLGRAIARVLQEQSVAERTPVRSVKIGRNDPCPCGSGKKYKKCCGASVH
jgi:uncharacterized protein